MTSTDGRSSPRYLALMNPIAGICAFLLPMGQHTPIAPPQVRVCTTYPGADAQSVARTATSPIERQII